MNLLDNITSLAQRDAKEPSPKPLVIASTDFKNPRFKEISLDTSGESASVEGVFSIDLVNTGILPTRGTRITEAKINLNKGKSILNVGEITEPVGVPSVPAGKAETIDIGFERSSPVVNELVTDICDNQVVSGYVKMTIAEILFAATYEDSRNLRITDSECNTLSLQISGQDTVNVDQQYEWSVSTEENKEFPEPTWSMGDGTTKSGKSVEHTYSSEASYTVTAELPSGISAEKQVTAEVIPLGIVGPTNALVDQSSVWTATGTIADSSQTLTWNMGDGSDSITGEVADYTYTSDGSYTIEVTSDSGESASLDVNVEFPDVDVNINGSSNLIYGDSNDFSAVGSQMGLVNTFEWSMGDGTILSGRSISHTYNSSDADGEARTYDVRVNAMIQGETVDSATETVNTGFSQITVQLQDERTVTSNETNTYSATMGNEEEATNVRWSMGDGTIYQSSDGDLGGDVTTVEHSYPIGDGGESYEVTAEAFISGNLINSSTMDVTVDKAITVDLADTKTVQSGSDNPPSYNAQSTGLDLADDVVWSMGDGTIYSESDGDLGSDPSTITHEYDNSSGGDTIEVKIEARVDGNVIDSDTMDVTVNSFLI